MIKNQIMLSIISTLAAIFLGLGIFAFLKDASGIHPLLGNRDFATILIALGTIFMIVEFRLLFSVIKHKRAAQEHN